MSMQLQQKSPTDNLTRRYIKALTVVALVLIAGQVGIQFSNKRQYSDAATINIAGRQRMLSQRLAKATLAIQTTNDPAIAGYYLQELQQVVDLWEKSHRGLQFGDASLGLSGNNSAKVELMFAEISAAHDTMLEAARSIVKLSQTTGSSPGKSPEFAILISQVLKYEATFLQGMDAIVQQYEKEAQARVSKIAQIQWLLLGITLLVLLLEAFLIFYPGLRQIEEYITEIQIAKSKAAELSEQLEAQNTELETSLAEAYSATRIKSEFVANMSHELLTPMNAVLGMTSLLQQTQLNPQQQEFVATIHQSGGILLQMINDILDFSKLEAGQLQLANQPLDLRQCIEESMDLVAMNAAQKGLDLAYQIDEQTSTHIFGDYARLRQILVNLLTNAVKFTKQGEVVISVSSVDLGNWSVAHSQTESQLFPSQRYEEIHFSIKDTGIGIPEDKINQLFRFFSQLDGSNVREYGGLGLGLAICKRLIQRMNGRLWVESQLGMGSTFSFTIASEVLDNTFDAVNQLQPALQGKRLLIVDPHEFNRQMLRGETAKWGMIITEMATGIEALQLIQQGEPFDVAFLAMQMPQMDGLSLARLIHQEKHLPHLKIVMMSAIGCPVKLPDSDVASCLSKPIKLSQLYQVMMDLFVSLPALNSREQSEPPRTDKLADRLPLRILVAEDNVVNQKVALRILSTLGYQADVAKNGLEAIAALEQKPYDLVLMDVQMPKMDGLQATRQICQQWAEDNTQDYATEKKPWIIAVTAGGTGGDRDKCLAAGMDNYLKKPINIELLKNALEQLNNSGKVKDKIKLNNNGKEELFLVPKIVSDRSEISWKSDEVVSVDWQLLESLRSELSPDGDRNLLGEILELFLEDTPSLLATIREAINTEDATMLKYAAHSLKGSASNLGIRKMYYLCFTLQELGTQGFFLKAAQAFEELEAEFSCVKSMFEAYKK
jgi:signal transduction histidine kinase/DNA-binding response OmpR family regulator